MEPLLQGTLFGLPVPIILAAFGAFVVILLVGVSVSGGGTSRKRVEAVVNRTRRDPKDQAAVIHAIMRPKDRHDQGLEGVIRKILPNPQLLRQRLERAGLKLTLGRYALIAMASGVVSAIALWRLTGLPLPACVLFGITLGILLPHFYVGLRIGQRKAKFLNHFPEAIDLIVRGLKSGLPVTESIKTVGTEIIDPVGGEFRQMTDAIAFGATFDEALWAAAVRVGLPDFNFFVVTLEVQRETGGNLAETLENLSDVLRKRKQAKMKVKALSGEAKASAYIIGSLPFIMFAMISTINPEYVRPLFEDPRGHAMTAVGLIWMTIGHAVMAKMVRFEI